MKIPRGSLDVVLMNLHSSAQRSVTLAGLKSLTFSVQRNLNFLTGVNFPFGESQENFVVVLMTLPVFARKNPPSSDLVETSPAAPVQKKLTYSDLKRQVYSAQKSLNFLMILSASVQQNFLMSLSFSVREKLTFFDQLSPQTAIYLLPSVCQTTVSHPASEDLQLERWAASSSPLDSDQMG